jgi:hypothetical protein
MTDEALNRIASALERIAAALEVGDEDTFTFLDRITDISKALENLDDKGIETYEQNQIGTYEVHP